MDERFLPAQHAEAEVDAKDTACGLGACAPKCLQKYANPKIYLIFFCLTGTIQGAYFTYFIGILTTLEKRYSFDSWISGVILIADNISPAIFSVIVGYFGKYIHRPRLVVFGLFINVLCCFLSCLPYVLYGSEIKAYNVSSKKNVQLCSSPHQVGNCESTFISESVIAISVLFAANFFKGFGSTAYYTIGTPYLDDNVKKTKSPLYIGAMFAMRLFGPPLGFMLSSFCLKFYENPFIEPDFGINDSRWIGAWWIGFVIIGILLILTSFPILFFPRYMPKKSNSKVNETSEISFLDLFFSLKKLCGNPILMCHTLSIIFQINGLFGYLVFMPKYIENQYRDSASSANLYSGGITLLATVPSVFAGGFCISKLQPKPKFLTAYMLFVQVFAGAVMVSALFMNCHSAPITGKESFLSYKEQECNSLCSCNKNNFSPICDVNGNTYFSACSAGCYESESSNKVVTFRNCSCISSETSHVEKSSIQATKHICSEECDKFLPYIISITISKIFASTVRAGNFLVTVRCVDAEDKTLALGLVEFCISVLASIPYPLLYGYAIDKSCLLWDETCNQKGNCLFYDNDLFRYYLHGLSIFFIFLAACCDFVVFLLSSKMNDFYHDHKERSNQNIEFAVINHTADNT